MVLAQIECHRDDIVAMGEIGLPHYVLLDRRMTDQQARERQAFLEVLVQGAARSGLPVVLHAPHAMAALALNVVERYEPAGAVFHWHKSTPETTAAIHEAGYYISVTPEVCYRERDQQLVQAVPLDRLSRER
jgi:TatD DNase family protein